MASRSPRRKELLAGMRIPFQVIPPAIDESDFTSDSVSAAAAVLAVKKLESVMTRPRAAKARWILSADTLVELNGRVMGKPADIDQAREFLLSLAGRVHHVHTALALFDARRGSIVSRTSTTEVKFKEMTPGEVDYYLRTKEWVGAAGGYRIQERGGFFTEWIRGSYSNVVGLPLETLYALLKEHNYRFTP